MYVRSAHSVSEHQLVMLLLTDDRFISEYGRTYSVLPLANDWKASIVESNFTLAPRGFGETSFR
jgi:hypothetical protein